MISAERLEEILNRFDKVKIAVVGDMMLDEYLIGKVNRISPEAPVPGRSVKCCEQFKEP